MAEPSTGFGSAAFARSRMTEAERAANRSAYSRAEAATDPRPPVNVLDTRAPLNVNPETRCHCDRLIEEGQSVLAYARWNGSRNVTAIEHAACRVLRTHPKIEGGK